MRSTLAKLSLCRSKALGERWYRCRRCQSECKIYNSCGDRHCPCCRGGKRAEWADQTSRLLLSGVHYFQVVFTLPKELSSLALGNRRAIYDLLFTASWRALKATVESEQRYQAAALMVLHTWNQRLEAHGHVHAVVPGGGPSLKRTGQWRSTRRRGQVSSFYLVDAGELRRHYRDYFLEGLRHLHARGALRLEGEYAFLQQASGWEGFLAKLASTCWVAYIEPPPSANCRAESVVRYLSRYLTGGPISDRRLIDANEHEVRFWAREGKTVGGSKKTVAIKLTPSEFVRRWSLHVLPKGYVKTRRYGGWSNKQRQEYLACCRELLGEEEAGAGDVEADCVAEDLPSAEELAAAHCCPSCGEAMELVAEQPRPGWSSVGELGLWPPWYYR